MLRKNIMEEVEKAKPSIKLNWWEKNRDRVKIYKKHYYSVERNFILQTIRRPFKPSVMYPKLGPKEIKDQKSYLRKSFIPEIDIAGVYDELMLQIELMKKKFPGSDGRLCRYCEQPWTYIRPGNKKGMRRIVKTNFSVDRFDPTQTYKKGNLVFCCSGCNSLKNNSTKKHWLKFLEIDKEINEQ